MSTWTYGLDEIAPNGSYATFGPNKHHEMDRLTSRISRFMDHGNTQGWIFLMGLRALQA
jgi:hypothetical protein